MAEDKMKIFGDKKEKNLVREETRDSYLVPSVDIYETEEGLVLLADLPGVSREQLHIHIEQGLLTIEGKPDFHEVGEELFSEFTLNGFYRQFRLPETLDGAASSAQIKNGVLTVKLPRAAAARPRRIEVTRADG